MAIFITKGLVNVRSQPSLRGQVVGQVGLGQEVQVQGESVTADNWIWQPVADSDSKLWMAERTIDGTRVLMERREENPRLEGVTMPLKRNIPNELPQLPPNIDLPPHDYERTFRAAIAITRAFEGGAFNSYQNVDTGIVSYGIMQFTLGSGSLGRVIDLYLTRSDSPTAVKIQNEYLARIRSREASLRNDTRFRQLLSEAAEEPAMQTTQFDVARSDYWEVMLRNYVQRRGNIRLPLTYALWFDMAINFGVNHAFVRLAEEDLGVPSNSRVGENGTSEQQLSIRVAELRRDSHYRQAARDNLPGLRVRGDFWVAITQAGDWQLQGDAKGLVYPKQGRSVQVKNPD